LPSIFCAALAAEAGACRSRGPHGFVQLAAEGFHKLTPREQILETIDFTRLF